MGQGDKIPQKMKICYELLLLGRTQVKDLTHLRFSLLTCRSAVAGLEIVDGIPRGGRSQDGSPLPESRGAAPVRVWARSPQKLTTCPKINYRKRRLTHATVALL